MDETTHSESEVPEETLRKWRKITFWNICTAICYIVAIGAMVAYVFTGSIMFFWVGITLSTLAVLCQYARERYEDHGFSLTDW